MNFSVLIGISIIAIGAFSSGSFAVPFGKVKGWQWETYWMIFSFGAYIIFPLIACFLLAPDFITAINATSNKVLLIVFFLGVVYGIGNLSFGLALRYLGLSLGYAISLGLMMAIGTLIPPLIDGRLISMIENSGGNLLIAGILVAVFGIILSAWAGVLKDKKVSDAEKKQSINEYNLTKGLLSAFLVGITGSALALGLEQGQLLSTNSETVGISPLFSMLPVFLILLSGTFISTLVWCIYLGIKNHSLNNYKSGQTKNTLVNNYLFSLLAGALWISQFILYSMGKSKMGPFTFTSWGILMALTIAFAIVWGLIRKEWKGATFRIYLIMILSILILITASFMIGISGFI